MKVISIFLLLSCQLFNIVAADSISLPKDKTEILCLQRKYQDSNMCKKWFQSRNQVRSTIINGTDAPVDEYSWFARALVGEPNNEEWGKCGGMLVAPDWVLTAAHCTYYDMWTWTVFTAIQIGALSNPISGDNGGQYNEILRIKYIIEHPNYKQLHSGNGYVDEFAPVKFFDFALVKLTQESTITPVDMDLSGVVNSYTKFKKLWTIGFGDLDTYQEGNYPNWLQHVELSFVPKETCLDIYSDYPSSPASEYEMCAGDSVQDPSGGPCSGDGGGPLYDKQSMTVVGVASWGPCGSSQEPKYPGVYAKISEQAQWIKETICSDTTADLDYCEGFTPTAKVWGSICDSDQDCYQEYKCIESLEISGIKRCYWGDERKILFGFCSTGDDCERGACIDNDCVRCSSNDDCPATSSGEGICFENSHCTSGRENEQCINDDDCLGECDKLCNDATTEAPSLSISPSISSSPSVFPSLSMEPSISSAPSIQESSLPSSNPSSWPSNKHSELPSLTPSSSPSLKESSLPSSSLSSLPSDMHSELPSSSSSSSPSLKESSLPSSSPSSLPSDKHSELPSLTPSIPPSSEEPSVSQSPSFSSSLSSAPSVNSLPSSFDSAASGNSLWTINKVLISLGIWLLIV